MKDEKRFKIEMENRRLVEKFKGIALNRDCKRDPHNFRNARIFSTQEENRRPHMVPDKSRNQSQLKTASVVERDCNQNQLNP